MCFLVVHLPVTQQNVTHMIVRAIISMHSQNSCCHQGAALEPEMLPSCSAKPLALAVYLRALQRDILCILLIRSLYWSAAWTGMRLQLMLAVKNRDFVTPHV